MNILLRWVCVGRCFAFLAVCAPVLVASVGCGESESESTSIGNNQVTAASFNPEHAPTVEFSVPDMMCQEGCGAAVEGILAKQPGAKEVLVDFDAKTATVAIEEGKFDSDKALAALVDKQFLNSSLKDDDSAKPQAADAAIQ